MAINQFEIKNCFDSHVHFLATGQVANGLQLRDLKSVDDLSQVKILKNFFRDEWLIGFGWNHLNWTTSQLPNYKILDQYFPDIPVFFSRVDGHASWLNSVGLKKMKELGFNFDADIQGGVIDRDIHGNLTGLLFDQAHIKALQLLPSFNEEQLFIHSKTSMSIFNQAGFTHVRDLSMTAELARVLFQIYELDQQTLYIEAFVTVESVKDLDFGYSQLLKCRSYKNPRLKTKGLKIFIDGSLGSETAYISDFYNCSHFEKPHQGLLIWSKTDIQIAIEFCWQHKIEIAIHAIGDAAIEIAVEQARIVSAKGSVGILNIEHAQLLRRETIQKMKPLHIKCFMQPCHWLSDKIWLDKKINSSTLFQNLFQWSALSKNKINLYFGSDSPIEKPSVFENWKAMSDASNHHIQPLSFPEFIQAHSHENLKWGNCKTFFENEKVRAVYFDEKKII